jgi:hypothetical protein
VRIGQADNLPSIAWVGEDFLITGEAGIENDFAAAARDRAGRAAIKYAPVVERQSCRTMQNLGQCALRWSFFFCFCGDSAQRTKMVHGPIGEYRSPIDKPAGHRAKHS